MESAALGMQLPAAAHAAITIIGFPGAFFDWGVATVESLLGAAGRPFARQWLTDDAARLLIIIIPPGLEGEARESFNAAQTLLKLPNPYDVPYRAGLVAKANQRRLNLGVKKHKSGPGRTKMKKPHKKPIG